jgi:hypothetical protein
MVAMRRRAPPFVFVCTVLTCAVAVCDPAASQTTAMLSGTAYFNGKVMPGFPVTVYSKDRLFRARTDNSGVFEFHDLVPGTYDLEANDLGLKASIYGIRVSTSRVKPLVVSLRQVEVLFPLDVDCGRTFWVSYQDDKQRGSAVSGSLTFYPEIAAPNNQFKKAHIELFPETGAGGVWSASVSEDGHFELKNIYPGRYRLVARSRGYYDVKSTVWVMREIETVTRIVLIKHRHPILCE